MVALGEGRDTWTIEFHFLILLCRSVYSCILGGPFAATLDIMAYPVHLKLINHNNPTIINADLLGAKLVIRPYIKTIKKVKLK